MTGLRTDQIIFGGTIVLLLALQLTSRSQLEAVQQSLRESSRLADSLQLETSIASAERRTAVGLLRAEGASSQPLVTRVDASTGDSVSLRADQLDVIVVVSSRCPHCLATLVGLAPAFASKRAVVASFVDSPDELREMAERHELPYPMISAARTSGLWFDGGYATPTTIVLHEGRINRLRKNRVF